MSKTAEKPIPLAYFITFTCYGTWLHGAKKTSVDKKHNIYATNYLPPNHLRKQNELNKLHNKPYYLDQPRRQIILKTIKEVCEHREWLLIAAHVRTNHVHMAIRADEQPELILNSIKAYASRRLGEAKIDDDGVVRWTRHGSTHYLWRFDEVVKVVRYIVHEQGEAMVVYVHEKFDFPEQDHIW